MSKGGDQRILIGGHVIAVSTSAESGAEPQQVCGMSGRAGAGRLRSEQRVFWAWVMHLRTASTNRASDGRFSRPSRPGHEPPADIVIVLVARPSSLSWQRLPAYVYDPQSGLHKSFTSKP